VKKPSIGDQMALADLIASALRTRYYIIEKHAPFEMSVTQAEERYSPDRQILTRTIARELDKFFDTEERE
jgi:hypothetical protein